MEDRRPDPPFHTLSFTLVRGAQGRSVLRMARAGEDAYSLHVEQGSGGNPQVNFTRTVPQATAQRLKDALQDAGVFGWAEEYGSQQGAPPMKWTLKTVFKEGVFSMESRGGSQVPSGFDDMMEAFYRLDLPRPEEAAAPRPVPAPAGVDFAQLADLFGAQGPDSFAFGQMQEALAQAQNDPAAFQQRMRMEFASMPESEQNRLIDALAATGLATRDWWERFLRGGA